MVTEVDGTSLKAQREAAPDFAVPPGHAVQRQGGGGSYRKAPPLPTKGAGALGGSSAGRGLGGRLFLAGEARLGLSHARHLLLVGDGAEGIEAPAGHQRWKATYQLDWWHLAHALHRTGLLPKGHLVADRTGNEWPSSRDTSRPTNTASTAPADCASNSHLRPSWSPSRGREPLRSRWTRRGANRLLKLRLRQLEVAA